MKAYSQYKGAIFIQKWWRCETMASSYDIDLRVTKSVIIVQSVFRMRQAQEIAKKMAAERLPKRVAPAQQIQQLHKRTFSPPRRTLAHGLITISRREIKDNAATAIEKSWRGYSTLQNYCHALGSVILIQAFPAARCRTTVMRSVP
jgi:hypothetical protein